MVKMRMILPLLCAAPLVPACSSFMPLSMTPTVKPSAAVTHSRERPETYYQLGRYLQGQNRLSEAAEAYRRALALDPRFHEAEHRLGVLHAMRGEYDRAVEHLRAALAHAPGSAYLHNNLGYTYLLKQDYQQAIAAFEAALAVEPHSERALSNLASAYAAAGQGEQAGRVKAQLAGVRQQGAAAQDLARRDPQVKPVQERTGTGPARTPDLVLREINPSVYELVTKTAPADRQPAFAAAAPAMVRVAVPQLATAPQGQALPPPPIVAAVPVRVYRLEVSNGNGIAGMARRVGAQLKDAGLNVVRLTDQVPYRQVVTEVQYREGFAAEAAQLAGALQVPADLVLGKGLRSDIHVRLVLGRDVHGDVVLIRPTRDGREIVADVRGDLRR